MTARVRLAPLLGHLQQIWRLRSVTKTISAHGGAAHELPGVPQA
jgi:hypothetical protein